MKNSFINAVPVTTHDEYLCFRLFCHLHQHMLVGIRPASVCRSLLSVVFSHINVLLNYSSWESLVFADRRYWQFSHLHQHVLLNYSSWESLAGVCRSPSPAVFSPSSTCLSVLRDLQKYRSIPGWLEVGFLLLMGTRKLITN